MREGERKMCSERGAARFEVTVGGAAGSIERRGGEVRGDR